MNDTTSAATVAQDIVNRIAAAAAAASNAGSSAAKQYGPRIWAAMVRAEFTGDVIWCAFCAVLVAIAAAVSVIYFRAGRSCEVDYERGECFAVAAVAAGAALIIMPMCLWNLQCALNPEYYAALSLLEKLQGK